MNSFSWFALTILTNNLLLYVTYVMEAEQLFVLVLVAVLVRLRSFRRSCWRLTNAQSVCTLTLPLWAVLSKRFGKKKIYFAGTTILMAGLVPCAFIPTGAIGLAIFLPALAGVGLGVLYLVPYSMIPDVVEVDELKTGMSGWLFRAGGDTDRTL